MFLEEEGARTLSEKYHGTLEQGTDPTIARIGPWAALVIHLGMYPAFARIQLALAPSQWFQKG